MTIKPTRRKKKKKLVEQIVEESSTAIKKRRKPKGRFSSGSTLLNLACTDDPHVAFAEGRMVNLIGDSSSGKSFVAMTILAEVANNKALQNYRLVYDDAESAMSFDKKKLFGKKLCSRVKKPPRGHSKLSLDFQNNVLDLIDKEDPFIYVLDSFDAISDGADVEKMRDQQKGKKVAGTYGMGKAKFASNFLGTVISLIEDTSSMLLIISQTRANISAMSFAPKTRSGGNALKFYATHEIWLAKAGKIKKKDREVGVLSKAKVTKNKINGKCRVVEFPISYDYGIDDIGSCVDFLVKEGRWKKQGTKINASDFDITEKREKLIQTIEQNENEIVLKHIVAEVWCDIEDSIKTSRKPKYE